MRNGTRLLSVLCLFSFLAAISTTTFATVHTTATPKARVTARVDNSKRATLYGHVPGAVRRGSDLGHVDPNTVATHMVLVLKSDEDQKRELRKVIDEQQDKKTGNYHQWVTPQEFGSHFGVHDDDIEQVKAWLVSQGFTIDDVAASKRVIHFSGTTGQIEQAFQTQMHYLLMPNGEMHVSNDRDISIPEALKPVIAGVSSLNDFFRKSHNVEVGRYSRMKHGPHYSNGTNCGSVANSDCFVGPADFATIYNTAPLLASGINGTGVTIGIVGRSDILMSDVQTYRQLFNLPVNDPIFIHAGQDNGIQAGDDGESDLDVEISGGIAPAATVKFVIGTPTFLVDGITNSEEYIVENNIADIMSTSYGDCEGNEGAGGNAFNSQIFEQAAAQGISVFVADGDNGPAECDDSNDSYEVLGYAASAEGSTPYNISVGGTEFDEGTNTGYWSNTNNPLTQASAVSYIPEYPWNEAKSASPTSTPSADLAGLWSGSGGISAYYLQPAWQHGSGVPTTDPVLTQGGDWLIVTITNPGSGYTTAPSVTFSGETCTSNPTTASTTISGGQVTSIVYNDGTQGGTLHVGQGFGCTVAGTVTFTAPSGGTTATGTVALAPMQNVIPLVSGVPHRYTPDVSLNAASDHDATFFCSEGVCEISSTGVLQDAGLVGGTSVAAPSMAGIQALINQANGGRQGMPGYIYYTLANNQYVNNPATCNSSGPPAANAGCVFQDITTGNNLICGTSSCSGTTSKIGFNAGTGYDFATGLGSVNAANLSSQWSSVTFASSATTLNLSQTTFAHGTSVTLSGTVTGSGTPTGDVAFIVSQGAIGETVNQTTGALNGPVAFATLSGGSYSATLNNLPGGTYYVTARYGGDDTYGSSYSTAVPVTVSSESSAMTITPYALNGTACTITSGSSFAYASDILINVNVAGVSGAGTATGTVTISDNGTPIASGQTLDPNGDAYLLSGPIGTSSCVYEYSFDNVANLSAGSHSITATYSGDSSLGVTTAGPVNITVTKLTPTLTLASGATLITSGFSTPLTATFGLTSLTGSSTGTAPPTGTVTFTDTTTSAVLGTAPVVSTATSTINAQTTAFAAVAGPINATGITTSGPHSITATYSGDSNWAGVTSSAVTVTVGTYTTTSTTTVTSSANPTTLGGRPTLTATIGVASGTAPSSGTVTFYDTTTTTNLSGQPAGTYVLGTGTVGTSHTATFRPSSSLELGGGTHTITATFGGVTTTVGPSTSAPFTQTVTLGTVTNVLSAKTVGKSGQNYYFTSVITPSSTSTAFQPTANVQFFDACSNCSPSYGATSIGTASLYSISSGNGGYGLYEANLSTNSLPVGTHTITSTYLGDVNYPATASNSQTVFAGGTPTITWATPAAITYPAALSATQLNSTFNIPATSVYSPVSGTVLAPGNQTLSVTYTPLDYTDFGPQTKTVTQVVNKQLPTITVTNVSPATEAYGQNAAVTITAVLSWTGSGAIPTAADVVIGGNGPSTYSATSCSAPSGTTMTCSATYTPTAADAVGSYTESAAFAGDAYYSAASSTQSNNFTITTATAGTTVNCTPDPSAYGASVTCTATVSGEYGLIKGHVRKNVTGSVSWSSNTGCSSSSVTGNPGIATCTTSSLPVGSDTITATYSGDGNHNGSAGSFSQTVNQAATSLSVTIVSPSSEDYGLDATVTITAVLSWSGSGTAPTASNVIIGGNGPSSYGTTSCGTPSGNTLTCSNTYTPTVADGVGSYTESASFSGDANYTTSASTQNNNFIINLASSTTTVGSTVNPSTFGQAVTFTATIDGENGLVKGRRGKVKSQDITGNVTWSSNTGCGTTSVTTGNPGVATCVTSLLPVGTDPITATYNGDANHGMSTGTLSPAQTVNASNLTIAVTGVNPATEAYGQDASVTITAQLSWTGSGAAPTASDVTIGGNGPSSYGTTTCQAPSGNTMTCTNTYSPTASDTPGAYTESAAFSGDNNYGAANSSQSNNFTINDATTTMTVTSGGSPSAYGQPVIFTATITGQYGLVKRRSNGVKSQNVSGTVTWSPDTGCGTTNVTAGVATCTTSALPVGSDHVYGTYSGDSEHSGSSGHLSSPQVVNQAATTLSVTSVNPSSEDYGSNGTVTITAVLSWTGTGTAPTASDVTIGGNGPSSYGTTSCGTPSGNTITCTNTYSPTSADGAGSYTESATFSGDSNYTSSSSSQTGNFTINPATSTTSVVSGGSPTVYGTSVTFTATINGENGLVKGRGNKAKSQTVTGSVAWSPNTGCGTTSVTSGDPGVATCTTSILNAGTDSVTGTYSGDANHSGSAGSVNQVVSKASQTITVSSVPTTATKGSSFVVTATGGGSGIPLVYTSSGNCTNSGATYTMGTKSTACSVIINQAGDGNYTAASQVTDTVTVAAALIPVVSLSDPATATYGTTFTVVANSGSDFSIPTFVATPSTVCTINGSVVTMVSGTGTCTVTATWAANDVYAKATAKAATTAAKVVSVVTWPAIAPITYGTPLGSNQLNASSTVPGTYKYNPASGKVLAVGTTNLSVTFTPTSTSDYTTVVVDNSITVTAANTTTTISSTSPANPIVGQKVTVDFTVSNTTASYPTGAVTVTASTGETCSGNLSHGAGSCKLTFTAAGSPTVTASYPGNADNNGSVSSPVTITVSQ